MSAWLTYTVVALGVALAGAVAGSVIGPAEAARGIRFAAGLAWVLQVAAFAFMVSVRQQPTMFLAAFASGIAVRFAVVGGVAFWVTRTNAYPPAPTLVGLTAFLFAMLLLEPVFLKKGLSSA